jgi:thiol:disulfide interchange protein DsbC
MLVSINIYAENKQLNKEEIKNIRAMSAVLKRSNISIEDGLDLGSVYFLKLYLKKGRSSRFVNAFVSKDTNDTFIGNRYTPDGQKSIFPETDKSIQSIKEGISFSYGSGKKEIYLVTDPQCPYCVKFEKKSKGKLSDYTVHVILYPLAFHKKAPLMVEWILQGKDDKEKKKRMEALMLEGSKEYQSLQKETKIFTYSKAIKERVEKSKLAAKILKTTGTPSVYNANFQKTQWATLVK